MLRMNRYVGHLLIATALLAPLAASGCAAHVRYYDEYHSDYHHWDDREDRAYRVWLGERRYEWREFNRLNRDEQRDYWRWRHDHRGRY
jgi:hypothetical protein